MIWDDKPPKKEGFFWFYGKRFEGDDIELRAIQVYEIGNNYLYSGGFISNETEGYWTEITKPDISSLRFQLYYR